MTGRTYSLISHPYPTSYDKLPELVETRNFLNNELRSSEAQQLAEVADPATGHLVSRVPMSTDAELSAAVDSAEAAFPTWRDAGALKRQQIMFRYVNLIRSHWDRLAASITLEQGKTLADARGDVLRGLQVAETACGVTTQITGDVLEVAKDMDTRSYKVPLGVVAAICPFNFPAMIPLWSTPIATITGNTIVIKPSERDPGAAMILAELAKEADFPNGVINVIHGSRRSVYFIINEPRIKAISFVGSTSAGEYIYAQGSTRGKRVQANLGAKNHAVMLPDSNKNNALNAIAGAAFGAAGQRFMALSTLVTLPDTKPWLADLVDRARALKAGPNFDAESDLGPVISTESKARIEGLIASADSDGAEILLDGRGYKPEGYPDGNWIGPTVISGVKPWMRCCNEEIFGPVLVCVDAKDLDDAITMINENAYGNGVAIFTSSGSTASYFQKKIEAGQVGINVPIPVPLPMFSFTETNAVWLAVVRVHFFGKAGLNFYTQTKTVTSFWQADDATGTKANVLMPGQH